MQEITEALSIPRREKGSEYEKGREANYQAAPRKPTSKDSLGAGCALHHGDNLSLFELNRLLELKGAGKDEFTPVL